MNNRITAGNQTTRDVASAQARGRFAHLLLSLLMLAGFAVSAGPAQAAQSLTLQHIGYHTLPGDRVQVILQLSGPAPKPTSFNVDHPARIALDLPGVGLAVSKRSQQIGVGVAQSVRAVAADNRTRVVLDLVQMVPYAIQTQGNDVVVTLGNAVSATATESGGSQAGSIKSINFHRGPHGGGLVTVKLSNPSASVNVKQQGKQIVAEFLDTKLPARLSRRLDVTDFATPVSTVDTVAHGNRVRMVIATTQDFEQFAYQTGDTFTIDVKPVTEAEKKAHAQKYTGQRLSLNFQNISVRAVLQLLADFTGMNLVASDSVQGNITLRLKDVPWDQALDIILKAKGLGMRKIGNVMMIAPAEELAAREKQELQAQNQIQKLAPLVSATIQVNYAKAADLAKLIKSDKNSLLSDRGSVTVDDRTNKLLVRDTADNIAQIRQMVAQLDVPVKQVLIQSRIVLATNDFQKELGVTFSGSSNPNGTSGMVKGADNNGTFNVSLPVTNQAATAGTLGIATTFLPGGAQLALQISAAQAEGLSQTISSPRVVTANQKKATIEQGVEIPYQQASSSGATSVSFKKAVLSLEVTPQITPDDRVIMDLTVNDDNPDYANAVLGEPPINTQKVTTQVLVDNGATVVLGGIYVRDKTHQVDRIPFFGDLPVVGALFRHKYNQDNKKELLIFVTPKILKQGMVVQQP